MKAAVMIKPKYTMSRLLKNATGSNTVVKQIIELEIAVF